MAETAKTTKKKSSKAKKSEQKELKLSTAEITEVILELAKTGTPTVKIGQILKDEHGVPSVKELAGKRIGQILKDNNLTPKLPADLNALIQKASAIRKHVATHRMDKEAKYGLMLSESKIRSLAKYYRQQKILPAEWRYEAEVRVA